MKNKDNFIIEAMIEQLIKNVSKDDAIRMIKFWYSQGMISTELYESMLIRVSESYDE